LHVAQLMPLPLTVSCSSKIQIGFTFLVPAHPGSPGKRAIKRVCVCSHGAGSMKRSRIRLSDCLSHLAATCSCFRFAAVGPVARRYRSIAARPAVTSSRNAAWLAAATAGSAALSADVGS